MKTIQTDAKAVQFSTINTEWVYARHAKNLLSKKIAYFFSLHSRKAIAVTNWRYQRDDTPLNIKIESKEEKKKKHT